MTDLRSYDDLIRIDLTRDGEDWLARIVTVDPPASSIGAELLGDASDSLGGSPAWALEGLGQRLDAVEAKRLSATVELTDQERQTLADLPVVLDALERAAEGPTASRAEPGELTTSELADATGIAGDRVARACQAARRDGAVALRIVAGAEARWRLSMAVQSEGGER